MTITPVHAWSELQKGNARFSAGAAQHPHQDPARRQELAQGQNPIATVLQCSDSRIAAEIIFDLGLGDAFVVRNAGQVASDSAIGSIEYAVGILHTPLLVVLGHEKCGAVRAAIDSHAQDAAALPLQIAHLIAPITPAVRQISETAAGDNIDPAAVDAAAVGVEHVRNTIAALVERSEIVAQAVADGTLGIIGASYGLSDGTVSTDTKIGLD